jgi:two-component system, NtrC family, sensor kinase
MIPEEHTRKKIRIPLFWKFTIGMIVVVVLFGSINVILVNRIIFTSLEHEMEHRGVFMSEIISQQAVNFILYDDIVALNVLIDEVKASDEAIEYILVCDPDCNVIAHTFSTPMPLELNDVHARRSDNKEILSEYIRFKGSDKVIRDISIPLLEGSIGFVRLGITEDIIDQSLAKATRALLGMILILIVISLVGTFIFSYLVTSPIKEIGSIAQQLNMQTIKDKRVSFAKRYPEKAASFMNLLPDDEIDILVAKFNEMVFRLQQAYEELEEAQKKLIQSEKLASIGTLAAGVAHEINNPLAGIINCVARMKRHPENLQESRKYLDLMEEATGNVETVIRKLLDFARQPAIEKKSVKIEPVVRNAMALAGHNLENNNISIHFQNNTRENYVWANQNQLEQVMLNLIINGMDAINESKKNDENMKGEIRIEAKVLNDERGIKIEVYDNGIGIPQENMNKIIDPFFTTKEVGKGTGLGLSVSLNIIRDHNGEMIINSQVNKGTVVCIILPVYIDKK